MFNKLKKRLKKKKIEFLYFAYGSNLSEKRFSSRIREYEKISNYKLYNYKLIFNAGIKTAYANIIFTGNPKDYVEGVLYKISLKNLIILDGYEGEPYLYIRETFIDKSFELPIVYYISKNRMYRTNNLPSKEYLQIIKEGMLENNIPLINECKNLKKTHIRNYKYNIE